MNEKPKKMKPNPETRICDLPHSEFCSRGIVTEICRDAGYWENPRILIANRDALNMKLGEFAEVIKRPKIKTANQVFREYVENKRWAISSLWWEIRQPEMMMANVIFVLLMLFAGACFLSAYIQLCDLLNR